MFTLTFKAITVKYDILTLTDVWDQYKLGDYIGYII